MTLTLKRPITLLALLLSELLLSDAAPANTSQSTEHAVEHTVREIPLVAPLNEDNIEFSGMAWCGNKLIMLPQYPERFNPEDETYLYAIEKDNILRYLAGDSSDEVAATKIRLHENEIRERMTFFDGYEAIACDDNTVWLSIEAKNLFGTYQAYIVPAELALEPDQPNISIRTDQIRYVKSQSGMINKGDEAIVLFEDHLVSLHEVNDVRQVPLPKGNRVHTTTGEQDQIAFENLPYRLTDASAVDDDGRFWVINYKYSGDRFSRDAPDTLAEQYGKGATHAQYYNAERLVEYQFIENKITRVDRAPIQLFLEGKEGRNWEGLVELDQQGFLLVTDKHPKTILGFITHPDSAAEQAQKTP